VDIQTQNTEINKGVRHGCNLLPTFLDIHLDKIVTKWQKEDKKGIPLPQNQQLLTQLLANGQVVISDTEDNLQKAAYEFNEIITERSSTFNCICTENNTDGIYRMRSSYKLNCNR